MLEETGDEPNSDVLLEVNSFGVRCIVVVSKVSEEGEHGSIEVSLSKGDSGACDGGTGNLLVAVLQKYDEVVEGEVH